jgi:PKD repeat protein
MGSVSAAQITTNSSGEARFIFTAPSSSAVGDAAMISVTPVGSAVPRNVSILLTGTANSKRPVPSFAFTPEEPEANLAVRFDASVTTDERDEPCLDACSYSWNFGDGSTGFGRIVSHTFTAGRTYTVTLTVTDAAGTSASAAQAVEVKAVAAPTVELTVAPDPPLAGQPAVLSADAEAAEGHSIVRYSWDFGDGTTETTTSSSVSKTYASRGTYVARVTVTDDVGQTGSAAKSFAVGGSGVTASFTFSPTEPEDDQTVQFNGSASSGAAGAAIVEWAWDFGDGDTEEDNDATTSHNYGDAGTYVVRLTVTDSNGRTGSTTQEIEVVEP